MRYDRPNNDLTLYIGVINEVFSKSNPYHICGRCWSIESRDSIRNHRGEAVRKKDIFPTETDRQEGQTLLTKLKEIARKNNQCSGDYVTCLVISKKQLECLNNFNDRGFIFIYF